MFLREVRDSGDFFDEFGFGHGRPAALSPGLSDTYRKGSTSTCARSPVLLAAVGGCWRAWPAAGTLRMLPKGGRRVQDALAPDDEDQVDAGVFSARPWIVSEPARRQGGDNPQELGQLVLERQTGPALVAKPVAETDKQVVAHVPADEHRRAASHADTRFNLKDIQVQRPPNGVGQGRRECAGRNGTSPARQRRALRIHQLADRPAKRHEREDVTFFERRLAAEGQLGGGGGAANLHRDIDP